MGLRERWIICNESNERALTPDQQEKSQQQISTQKKEISTQKINLQSLEDTLVGG